MKDFIDLSNFENTYLESENFSFNSFKFKGSETLPHWHNHIEIVYISFGLCTIFINGNQYICTTGELIIIPQNSLHSIIPEKDSIYHPIIIGDTLLNRLMNDSSVQDSISPFISKESFAPIFINLKHNFYHIYIHVILTIIDEFEHKENNYETIIKLELVKLFTYIKRYLPIEAQSVNPKKNVKTQSMIEVIDYIALHFSTKITVSTISKFSNLSQQHFCRTFKAFTGKTFNEYLTYYRLEKAYQLVVTTDIPITQIPELTGFCNENYFSRVFKKQFGTTPSNTRKNKYAN